MQVRALGADELTCRPGSVLADLTVWWRCAAIHLGPPLPAASCDLPVSSGGPPSNAHAGRSEPALLILLLVGFTEPFRSPRTLVVSYTTVSPLPPTGRSRTTAVCSLWHCPAGHPGWALPTTLPCGARTFLDAGRPTPRPPGQLIRAASVRRSRAVPSTSARPRSTHASPWRSAVAVALLAVSMGSGAAATAHVLVAAQRLGCSGCLDALDTLGVGGARARRGRRRRRSHRRSLRRCGASGRLTGPGSRGRRLPGRLLRRPLGRPLRLLVTLFPHGAEGIHLAHRRFTP